MKAANVKAIGSTGTLIYEGIYPSKSPANKAWASSTGAYGAASVVVS